MQDANFPDDSIRLVARLYEKVGSAESLAIESNGRHYDDLISHKEELIKSGRFEKFLKNYELFAGNKVSFYL